MPHVLITGGSSGIGKEIAKLHAARGDTVSILARRSDVLNDAVCEIDQERRGKMGQTLGFECDVSRPEIVTSVIGEILQRCGLPDRIVLSAGIAEPGYFEDLDLQNFRNHMEINYFGIIHVIRETVPAMKKRQSGQIVLISSAAGLNGLFGYSSYAPTKFVLRGLAEALRWELKRERIGITVVYPPDTVTPQLEAENATKPVETKQMTSAAKLWSAEAIAQLSVKGADRNRFAVTPGIQVWLLCHLSSVMVPFVQLRFWNIVRKRPGQ
ncbi:MAG: 3-dehydrosphinganine reductase [Sulfitobacter sp.]|jgi:3-dehydrosphinganine reductase